MVAKTLNMHYFCTVTGASYFILNYQMKLQESHHKTSFIPLFHTWLNSQNSKPHSCATGAILIDHFNEMSPWWIVYSVKYIVNINCLFYGDTTVYVDLYPTKHSTILLQRHFSSNNPLNIIQHYTLINCTSPLEPILMTPSRNDHPVTIVHGQIACKSVNLSKIKDKQTVDARELIPTSNSILRDRT